MNGRILLWFQTLRTPELNQIVLLLTNTKIGRASCRERV